ncbi:MAG: NAD(P)-dependent oxidoreductase [Eubacteriales bacterium]
MRAIVVTAWRERGESVYNSTKIEEISRNFTITDIIYKKEDILSSSNDFSDVEAIFATWGIESFSADEIRENLPNLKVLFYVGGSVKYFAEPFLECGIKVCGAWRANAVPVAEYVVSQMILGIKGVFLSRINRPEEWQPKKELVIPVKGFYNIKIGIVGSGAIGRKVIELLSNFKDNKLKILLYSRSLTEEDAEKLGVQKASLEEIFSECDIITNHIANNSQTRGFYDKRLFDLMGKQVVFINSGRGQQVVEADLADAMKKRPQSCALLDVTYPEPPDESCPFWGVDNIFINPHIAGSQNNELERMVEYMIEDAKSFIHGKELVHEINLSSIDRLA